MFCIALNRCPLRFENRFGPLCSPVRPG